MKTFPTIALTLALAVPVTWWVTRSLPHGAGGTTASAVRKVRFYQSAMHPWIKSDRPGRCTICGMELTPVYEGDAGFDAAGGGVVALSPDTVQVLNVQSVTAQVRPLLRTLEVAGVIDDNDARHRVMSAYVAGRIEKLHVNFIGAEVREGQPLVDLYSPALLQAEREYQSLTGEFRVAAVSRLRQMGLQPAQINQLGAKSPEVLSSEILSPMTGTVLTRYVYEGQYVQAGDRLFEIADFGIMWFQFQAYEQDLPWIKTGLSVDVVTPSHPGNTFKGKITFVDPTLDPVTRSTKVRVELANPPVDAEHRMLHRLYATGRVQLEAPDVLTVPRAAVLETGAEAVAYVELAKGSYARRVVQIGRRGDTLWEIRHGLSVGDAVVVNGNLLIDGQAELNRGFAEPEPAGNTNGPAAALPALSTAQREAVKEWLAMTDLVGGALAADDLKEFNVQVVKVTAALGTGGSLFAGETPWRPLVQALVTAGRIGPAEDLKLARRTFYPLSSAAVALATAARRADPVFAGLKVFRCPMTKDAFAGAPSRAEWIQLQAPVRNPWFGLEMLDCGAEVKPTP